MAEMEKEYIDLSDMDNNEIPEENPPESHIAVGHEGDTSIEETPVEETPQEQPEVKDEKENPESFKYWQSQHDKKEAELRQLRERYEEERASIDEVKRQIEEMRTQSQPKEQPLVPPQKPNSDDPMDMIKYQNDYLEYQQKLIEQQNQNFQKLNETWQEEQQRRQQEQQAAQQRAYIEGQFVKAGASLQESPEIIRDLSELQKNPEEYSKFVLNSWRAWKGQTVKTPTRATQTGEPQPLAGVPSTTETQKRDDADEFFGDQLDFQKRYY